MAPVDTPPRLRSPARRLRAAPTVAWLLAAAMTVDVVVFGRLTWTNHSNFNTYGFDTGIFDQGIWLLSRFKSPFVTIRGLQFFGNHVNLIVVPLVPAYWLGAGPHFLGLFQAAALAIGAVPIYLLARERNLTSWVGLALGCSYLLYPALEWLAWWEFHPDGLAIAPLLWAYLFAVRRRWTPFLIAMAIALSCKEDMAFPVAVLGLIIAARGRRLVGGGVLAAAVAWFVASTRFVIPWANHGQGPFYNEIFPQLGATVPAIIGTAIRHPSRVLGPALRHSRLSYYWQLLAPVAFVPVLALPVLLIAAPHTLINVNSIQPYTYNIRFQYSAVITVGVFLATVEACASGQRWRSAGTVLAAVVLASSMIANVTWSPSPLSRTRVVGGIWGKSKPHDAVVKQALALVPAGEGVSSVFYVVTHMTHRTHVYEFPNPWRQINWGIHGEGAPGTATVQWLLVDRTSLNARDLKLLTQLTAPGGEFESIMDAAGMVVAHRIRPPVHPFGPPLPEQNEDLAPAP